MPKFFGFSVEDAGPLREIWTIGKLILDGKANWTTFAIGASTLAVILLLKNSMRFSGTLVAVVGATVIAK